MHEASPSRRQYLSWGRVLHLNHDIVAPSWRTQSALVPYDGKRPVIPYGMGKSYGDVCLNAGGILIDTKNLNHFISFDLDSGVLRCESGVMLRDILKLTVPKGWFLPVVPGTELVTIGGALANDIHGKNHHTAGTFGCHVNAFELVRSSGEVLLCSRANNPELFAATIGGIGLTGLVTWVEIGLKKIASARMATESIKVKNLDEFLKYTEASRHFEYSVTWVDLLSKGRNLGRGLFLRGNHAERGKPAHPKPVVAVPFECPQFLLNPVSIKIFNTLFYHKQIFRAKKAQESYQKYFFPLDGINNWNLMYGKRGFYQYQFVVPEQAFGVVKDVLELSAKSGCCSFLSVLKKFGDIPSPGMMSFPIPGYTLAMDFSNHGEKTLALFKKFDELVLQAGGRVYLAKDGTMAPEIFWKTYPAAKDFSRYIDSGFSSSLWRRMNAL